MEAERREEAAWGLVLGPAAEEAVSSVAATSLVFAKRRIAPAVCRAYGLAPDSFRLVGRADRQIGRLAV
jgi:hypothetical protein